MIRLLLLKKYKGYLLLKKSDVLFEDFIAPAFEEDAAIFLKLMNSKFHVLSMCLQNFSCPSNLFMLALHNN